MCDLNTTSNVCAMDGAATVACTPTKGDTCPTDPQYYYVDPADITPYLTMAQTYAFADHMFQTNEGPSYPAHQFILSGTSAPSVGSVDFVAENPFPENSISGCLAVSTTYAKIIDPTGTETEDFNLCYEHPTLTDLLDNASPPITWRYYAPSAGSIWTAPTAINHMCGPNQTPPNATSCTGSDYTTSPIKVVLNQNQANAQVLTDITGITGGQLQQVSWVIPTGDDSDHAKSNNGCGPSWVTSIVDAIGNSQYWSNTVIIITWDDWGGWYDHVPPAQVIDNGTSWGSAYVYGFRVPMIVISPYAKPAYISHVNHDFGSILRFIENSFGLGQIQGPYADTYALDAPNSLSDMFQFTSSPVPFTQIAQPAPPLDASTCIGEVTGNPDPDDD